MNENDVFELINDTVLNYFNNPNSNDNNLNIKGKWGYGKTTFINKFKENYKDTYNCNVLNLWKYEISDNVFISILSDILKILKYEPSANPNIKKILTGVVLSLTRTKWIKKEIDEAKEIDDLYSLDFFNESLQEMINQINSLTKAQSEVKKIIIIFDELDRCTSEQMIKILSTIKNVLFHIENLFFIICSDSDHINQVLSSSSAENYTNKIFSNTLDIKYITMFDKSLIPNIIDNIIIDKWILDKKDFRSIEYAYNKTNKYFQKNLTLFYESMHKNDRLIWESFIFVIYYFKFFDSNYKNILNNLEKIAINPKKIIDSLVDAKKEKNAVIESILSSISNLEQEKNIFTKKPANFNLYVYFNLKDLSIEYVNVIYLLPFVKELEKLDLKNSISELERDSRTITANISYDSIKPFIMEEFLEYLNILISFNLKHDIFLFDNGNYPNDYHLIIKKTVID
ncbi:P-loop NTPase fold protein [Spiroplasma chrysopicola]|uniref:KAP NTPase domain-containing protein n=1 Tax=Spiroplasma chrysopicola DF-1 TaxID=1276227 RepID=R4U2B8_9MOLU|nr:P-loop NTPase fold protein [Spiroplasma chrysopicola]AGM25502.1 hypothetical protein SCHRY_v1c09290 [Spiroplasma chrysopicola DF-1]